MVETPDQKLQAFYDFRVRFGNALYGSGNSDGILIPRKLLAIICFGILFEIAHINGTYQMRSQPIHLCMLLMIYALITQLVILLMNRLIGYDHVQLSQAHNLLRKFIVKEQRNETHCSILTASLSNGMLACKWYFCISCVFYHTPVITAAIMSLWKQDFILAFNTFLPFTDKNELYGFLLSMVIQTLGSILVYLICMSSHQQIIFYPLQTVAMVNVGACKLETLAQRLIDFRRKKIPRVYLLGPMNSRTKQQIANQRTQMLNEIRKGLVDIIQLNENYNAFVSNMIAYSGGHAFAALTLNSIAIGLGIIYLRLESIPIGLGATAVFFFQVLLPCAIGTIISTQNQRLLNALTDFPWYELTPEMKKIYLQFIHQCQNAVEFEVPVIGVFNMESFTQVMNASYSYLTFLLNFT